eukprot:134556-Rhodomonas_salina.1
MTTLPSTAVSMPFTGGSDVIYGGGADIFGGSDGADMECASALDLHLHPGPLSLRARCSPCPELTQRMCDRRCWTGAWTAS